MGFPSPSVSVRGLYLELRRDHFPTILLFSNDSTVHGVTLAAASVSK